MMIVMCLRLAQFQFKQMQQKRGAHALSAAPQLLLVACTFETFGGTQISFRSLGQHGRARPRSR
eukprot:5065846-Pyramimonas_sp.AAC.1